MFRFVVGEPQGHVDIMYSSNERRRSSTISTSSHLTQPQSNSTIKSAQTAETSTEAPPSEPQQNAAAITGAVPEKSQTRTQLTVALLRFCMLTWKQNLLSRQFHLGATAVLHATLLLSNCAATRYRKKCIQTNVSRETKRYSAQYRT